MSARKSYQQEMWLDIAGESVKLRISTMKRRSMRLRVNELGEVDLRIPFGCAKAEVLAFVNANQHWLKEQRETVVARQQQALQSFSILGKDYPIQTSALDEFLVTEKYIWIPRGWHYQEVTDAMDKWLRPQARHYFQQEIERLWPYFSRYAEKMPVLRVKKMRTRWGSLSLRGYINLNLALMQLTPELIELVVVHELCHLRHFDHGAGFKALMTEVLPDWREREKALQQASSRVL